MTTTAEGYAQPPFGPNNPMPRGYAPPGYEMGPLDNLMTIEAYNALSQTPRRQPAPQFSGGQNNAATGSSMALPQQQLPPTPSNPPTLPQQQQLPPTLPPQIGQQKFGNSGIGSLGGGGGGQGNVSLNLQGSATVNPQGANQNRGYTGFDFNPGASGQMRLAEGGAIPAPAQQSRGIAALGRGKDTMLVHMTPGEVHGLQQLAMAHGGSLTINPQTGLPEAGFLSALLPMAAGFALGPAGFGVMSSLAAAGTVGGLAALASGSLKKGLMAGLGAYGGANLGSSLSSMGAEQANALARPELAAAGQAATTTGNAAADSALNFAQLNENKAIEEAIKNANVADATGDPTGYMGDDAYRAELAKNPLGKLSYDAKPTDFVANPYSQQGVGYMQSQGLTGADIAQSAKESAANASPMPAYSEATQKALARGPAGNAVEGFKQLGSKEGIKNLGGKLGYAGVAGLAAPLISSAMEPGKFNPPANRPSQFFNTSYNPPRYNPQTGTYEPAFYGPGAYSTAYGVEGGAVGYARGGAIPDFYPLTGDARGPGEKPQYSSDIYGDDSGAGINDNKAGRGVYSDAAGKGVYENTPSGVEELFAKTNPTTLARYKTAKNAAKQAAAIKELRKRASAVNDYGDDTTSAAQGGLMGTYAAGGKLLRGDGDGMSDSIPAVIQGANPQRAALADGEFVIPADVVSHLGNGSTEAGSKRLYSMMDKVRRARTGNPKQGKQINPDRFMPA